MAGKSIAEVIHQQAPFASLAEEAFIALIRTADDLAHGEEEFLAEHMLTMTQYNLLRILRGSKATGLPCSEIGKRLIARVPDVTRLVDRLERNCYVERRREGKDRRQVIVHITEEGMLLVGSLDGLAREHLEKVMGSLSQPQQQQLIDLLELLRGGREAN